MAKNGKGVGCVLLPLCWVSFTFTVQVPWAALSRSTTSRLLTLSRVPPVADRPLAKSLPR